MTPPQRPILLTGASGQVGRAVVKLAAADGRAVRGFDRAGLDVADPEQVSAMLYRERPLAVINTAAYTAVDRAEAEPERAFAVNVMGPRMLAEGCSAAGIPLLHVSTDFVFDGMTPGSGADGAYREDDPVNPLSVYGRTKWEGEDAVRHQLDRHMIVRTAWVFAPDTRNFVTTIAGHAMEREVLRVVNDQRGNPTPAAAVARALLDLLGLAQEGHEPWGTYHFAGEPAVTRHELALQVVTELQKSGRGRCKRVEPVPTSAFPTPAVRPADAALDMSRIRGWGIEPPDWHPAVRDAVETVAGPKQG
jgi:dTDP-4-dehydrorhamnose reductase